MAQYTPLGLTDIANLALLEIGQQPITDIDDQNGEAAAVIRAAFWPSVTEVGRSHPWSCLRKRAKLTQITFPQTSSMSGGTSIGWPGCYPATPPPYWLPATLYAGGTLVTWGEAIYYCLAPNGPQLSSNNFINDLTNGEWAQIYSVYPPAGFGPASGLYEWGYGYVLPADYLLMEELNGVDCRFGKEIGNLYEIFTNQVTNTDETISSVRALFCDEPWANVKYTALIQDPTMWDSLFIECVTVKMASKISTQIRGDDGSLALKLLEKYRDITLPTAKMKDAGEAKLPRYDPTKESNFLRSRYGSTAG